MSVTELYPGIEVVPEQEPDSTQEPSLRLRLGEHAEIESLIADYLAAGGTIQVIPEGKRVLPPPATDRPYSRRRV